MSEGVLALPEGAALTPLTPDAALDLAGRLPCAVNLLPEFRKAAIEEFRRGTKDQQLVGVSHGPAGLSTVGGLALYRCALGPCPRLHVHLTSRVHLCAQD